MDRYRYHDSHDSRDGYDDGVKDGKNQALVIIGHRISQITAACDKIVGEIQTMDKEDELWN